MSMIIKNQKIIGATEFIDFPDFQLDHIMAKIDTGAYSGSLHCTNIRHESTPNGEVLHFSPFDRPETVITTLDFIIKRVRSSNGHMQDRFFITTRIRVQGRLYKIQLSLANRSEMRKPVLIGRRFLRQHGFVVDVRKRPGVLLAHTQSD